MSENRVQIVIEGDAKSAQAAITGTGKALLDLSTTGEKASKSLKDADASTSGLGKTTQTTGQSIKGATSATSDFGKSTQAASQAANEAGTSLLGYVSNLKALAAAYGLYKAARQAEAMVLEAARYETMSVVMHTVGNAAGYTAKRMDEYAAALERQGISMLGSEESLARMIQGQIDLEKGVRLATAAQGAAILMNRTSTEAFETMTTAIATGLVINLHRMGVMADFERSYAREAAALGKSKEALTDRERVQARVNETLAKTKVLEDVYANAMGTSGKQLQTMVRYLSDFSVMVGSIGLESFTRVVFGSAAALKETNAELRKMMNDGTIATWSKNVANGFNETWKVIKLTTEVLGLFWLAWRGAVAVETAMLTLGLLKLELRALAVEITAAGGAWSYFNAQLASSVALFTTVSGVLLAISSAFSGILIGKYLVDNFKWAAEASLAMGETIQNVVAEFVWYFKIGVAELSGDAGRIAEAHRTLAQKLLTIRMTYLHERAELNKKFATPEQKAKAPEVLGNAEDQKATHTLERMNAIARKIQDAHKMLRAVQNETAQYMAEMNGDPQAIAMAKLQSELDKFEEQAKEKRIGAPAEAQKLIDAAVAAKRQEIQIKKDFQTQSIALDQDKLNAERRVQLDSLAGVDTYFADLEAIQKKYAAARLKPNSPDAKWAGVMEQAELAKRLREQEQKFQETSLSAEADNSKLRGEYYGTSAGHSASGALAEQAAQVEIERKQKLLALNERLAAVAATIVSIEARGANTPEKQAELERKAQEMEMLQQQEELLGRVAAAKQREIQASRDWGAGARKGFQEYSDAAGNYASQAENAVKNAFGGMEDAMASFMVKNKAEWSSMVDAILMDLVKIQLRASITKPISDFMGSLSIFPSAHGNVLGGDGISALSGGIYSQPTFFGFDQHITAYAKGGVLGEAGPEAVMPLTRDSSGNLGVRGTGGGDTFYATINLTMPASSGNQAQDKSFADDVGDAMQSGLNTWWEDRYRQAHRPGAIANGGVKL